MIILCCKDKMFFASFQIFSSKIIVISKKVVSLRSNLSKTKNLE